MNKILKYLAAALLFSFSVSSHAAQVSDELAHKVLTEGEPIASGSTGSNDDEIYLISSLRYRGEIYLCWITYQRWDDAVRLSCFDKH